MAIPISKGVPSEIRAGDSVSWTDDPQDYPSDSWELTYYFRRPGEKKKEHRADADGTGHKVELDSLDTGEFTTGRWSWFARATEIAGKGSRVIMEGEVSILADPDAEEPEVFAGKMLKAIRAVMLMRAGKSYNANDIGGTSFDHKTDDELRQSEQHWLWRVNQRRRNRRARERGRPHGSGRIHFRPSS